MWVVQGLASRECGCINGIRLPQSYIFCSNDASDKRAALFAIEELIDAKFSVENPVRIAQMAESIKNAMVTNADPILVKGAEVMGKLVRTGGNLAAEVANSEIKDALERLDKSKQTTEHQRLASCHMLRTLAGMFNRQG